MSDLLVQEPGPLTTIQDLGRFGHLRVGIPTSGPMDRDAFVLGNRLVGNLDGAAGLECTLVGPRLELTDDRLVAVTGAEVAPTLNGAATPPGTRQRPRITPTRCCSPCPCHPSPPPASSRDRAWTR